MFRTHQYHFVSRSLLLRMNILYFKVLPNALYSGWFTMLDLLSWTYCRLWENSFWITNVYIIAEKMFEFCINYTNSSFYLWGVLLSLFLTCELSYKFAKALHLNWSKTGKMLFYLFYYDFWEEKKSILKSELEQTY